MRFAYFFIDRPVFAAVLKQGDFRSFKGNDEVILTITRGAAVRITANGNLLGSPSVSPYRGVFSAGTTTLPPNEPVVPAAPPPSSSPSKLDSTATPPAGPSVPQNAYTGQ